MCTMCVFHPKLGNNHFTAIVCRNFNNFDKISLNLHILAEDYTWVNGSVHRTQFFTPSVRWIINIELTVIKWQQNKDFFSCLKNQ